MADIDSIFEQRQSVHSDLGSRLTLVTKMRDTATNSELAENSAGESVWSRVSAEQTARRSQLNSFARSALDNYAQLSLEGTGYITIPDLNRDLSRNDLTGIERNRDTFLLQNFDALQLTKDDSLNDPTLRKGLDTHDLQRLVAETSNGDAAMRDLAGQEDGFAEMLGVFAGPGACMWASNILVEKMGWDLMAPGILGVLATDIVVGVTIGAVAGHYLDKKFKFSEMKKQQNEIVDKL